MDTITIDSTIQTYADGYDMLEGVAHLPGCESRIEALIRVSEIIPRLAPRTQIRVGCGAEAAASAFQDCDGPADFWCVSARAPAATQDAQAWKDLLQRAGI